MQLVPLSADGRVEAVVTASLPPGPLRVALRTAGGIVTVEALGSGRPRRVGRLTATDAAAYRPVLTRLAARGHVGACPARVTRTGRAVTLTLQLGTPATCAPRDTTCAASPAVARTVRLLAAVPGTRRGGPRRACPPRPTSVPLPRVASTPTRRPPLPVRPPARFGQTDDQAPRLTRQQRQRVLWISVGVAALLLLASAVQQSVATTPSDPPATATGAPVCGSDGTPACRPPRA
jgi:hypothetical protein